MLVSYMTLAASLKPTAAYALQALNEGVGRRSGPPPSLGNKRMSLLCKKAIHRCQLTWLLLAAAAAAVLLIRLVRRRRRRRKTRQGKLRVAFAHPDLGLGGAERLVVDAALGLRGRGHDVTIYTARHDPRRCFDETRDGTLSVVVAGDWLPKRILGRCYALCASARMVAVALRAARDGPDVVVVDQVATAVPVARAACAAPVVFYCHYPDKLLCVNRQNPLTRLYRAPLDWGEETCTGLADVVLVCVEINQCVGCTRKFFIKSFLGDDAAVPAPSSGDEPAPPRHRAGVASMAWRTTRRFSTNAP